MFEDLIKGFQEIFEGLARKRKLSKKDIEETLRQIRRSLLEADVNLKVVKALISNLKSELIEQRPDELLTPAQTIVRITRDKLIEILGGEAKPFVVPDPPGIALLVGIQGSGKTTTAVKLAYWWHKQGRRPLLVGADFFRPAAVKQLQTLAERVSLPVVVGNDPVDSISKGLQVAKTEGYDLLVVDTTGRMHVDQQMMDELRQIKDKFRQYIRHVLLVVDAMVGQEAVSTCQAFDEYLGLTGFILTKLDGDTRGGAALSITYITGKPIYFIGIGEKVDQFDRFYPDRIVSRILGMGDILSLIERVSEQVDEEDVKRVESYLRGRFTLEDYLRQLQQIRKLGDLRGLLGMLPLRAFGIDPRMLENVKIDERELKKIEAIINSMTKKERMYPEIINSSRKARIARGSGTTIRDVNKVLKHYKEMKRSLKKLGRLTQSLDFEAIERRLSMLEKIPGLGKIIKR